MGVMKGIGVNEKRNKTEMMDNGVLGVPSADGRKQTEGEGRKNHIEGGTRESLPEM